MSKKPFSELLAALARRSGGDRSFETLAAAVDVSFNAILRLCEEATAGDSPTDPAPAA